MSSSIIPSRYVATCLLMAKNWSKDWWTSLRSIEVTLIRSNPTNVHFRLSIFLLDVLHQVPPLITTKYEKQRRQMEECYYIDDESSYSGSVHSSEINYNEVEGEYYILTVMEEMMSRVIENHLTYMSSSYLPLNNCCCIMGTSQPALSLDKQKTISKVHRE